MHAHRDVQAAFAAGLADGALPAGVIAPDASEVVQRFNVYRNNVSHGLCKALAAKFPVIERLVGEAFFMAMAREFAAGNRPENPILMLWGGAFPAFLERFPPLANYPYMADVARIELARGIAYHAADHGSVSAAFLADLATSGGDGVLTLHPAVQVLPSAYPACSIWHAHQPGHTAGPVMDKGAETTLVLRNRSLDVLVQRISAADTAFVTALQAGQTLIAAAMAAAALDTRYDPSSLLALLFQAGALIPSDDRTGQTP
jgi:hypothetical protein